jgi:ketosteroid isomerase-like protein/dienelactone hydrolase
LDDSYAALTWTFEQADELGVKRDCIGIGGASAGGNLAAATTLLARDRGELRVAFQALMYPMLDDRMTTASSSWDVPIWPPASNDFGWNAYLGGRRGEPDVSTYAAPARATDLADLPATFIGVGALDGFVDENIEYATRLLRSGTAVELHVYPGAPHGFDLLMPRTSVARRSRRHLDEWLVARLLEAGERAGGQVPRPESSGVLRANASAVAAAFEEWERTGSARAVFRLTAVDVVWRVPGDAPTSGTYTSRDAFLASAQAFTDRLAAPLAVTVLAVHDAGEHVVVEWRGTSSGTNGRPYDQRYCWVLRFVGQQISEVTAYADTALVDAMFED